MSTTRKILCMSYRPGNPTPDVNQEKCQGDCYAYDDVLRIKGQGWTTEQIRVTMERLLSVHTKICGNANYRLGIDLDETSDLFIGTFYRFGTLDVVTGRTVLETIEELGTVTAQYFASDRFDADQAVDSGLGHQACQHGDEQALKSWMARVGGFDVEVLAAQA